MSKMVSVKTIGAVVDGQPIGSTVKVKESTAKRLEAIGYVEILPKPKPAKKASAPKKTAKAKAAPKTKSKGK